MCGHFEDSDDENEFTSVSIGYVLHLHRYMQQNVALFMTPDYEQKLVECYSRC